MNKVWGSEVIVGDSIDDEMYKIKDDIKDKDGKVICPEGKRITARLVRQIEQAKLTTLELPYEFLLEKFLAKDLIDESTGEVIAKANDPVTIELLEAINKAGIKSFSIFFVFNSFKFFFECFTGFF